MTPSPSALNRLPARTPDGQARRRALQGMAGDQPTPPAQVDYHSGGSLLIIGEGARAGAAARVLARRLSCAVLATDGAIPPDLPGGVQGLRGYPSQLQGHLGAFRVTLGAGGQTVDAGSLLDPPREAFDLILDLCEPACIEAEIPPPGYFATGGREDALSRTLVQLPEMTGDFEKPRYFGYDPDICAHGRSGLRGCTRCLQACPTGAIQSLGEQVEVDPYLCQGAGSCGTVCPTGAIHYAFPPAADHLDLLRTALGAYRSAGPDSPAQILFHDAGSEPSLAADLADGLPENLLPVQVEDVGAVGMDLWLAALAYGAARVVLLLPAAMPARERRALREQRDYAGAVLAGMGYADGQVALLESDPQQTSLVDFLARAPGAAVAAPATFAALGEKRTTVRLALDHLHGQAPVDAAVAPLPAGAPFGEVRVDRDACTLCMACVSVCPTSALLDGGESPALRFVEQNCVQCGLCAAACPESAVALHARLLYDRERAGTPRTLHEETPFNCVACGRPFATRRMMDRMAEKLAGHWMFQTPEARRRLQMCEDCRVRDLFAQEGGFDVHRGS
ncbi:MAG TPA: 4Fe-4S dicluster domain-containing protein [Gammaproteobacteria bacterium]|nr:4Fe-4S dicluster domain-containing protein [Gammaproteobacteria bacterium]